MTTTYKNGLNLQATELRLGLPGVDDLQSEKQVPSSEYKNKKRNSAERDDDDCGSKSYSVISDARDSKPNIEPAAKHQVVGWPPVRHYRKNSFQQRQNENETMGKFVKVSMDGAPYLRKIDLNGYNGYMELLTALDSMFRFTMSQNSYFEGESCNRSEFKPTYEDKDGDWMLVGDVPWDMFSSSCKRLRIMRSSEARLSSSTDL